MAILISEKDEQRIQASIRSNPDRPDHRIGSNLRLPAALVAEVRRRMVLPEESTSSKPSGLPDPTPHGSTMEAFQRAHDPELLIDEAIAKYLSKPGRYYEDAEFREICRVPTSRWRRFADKEKYAPYRFCRGKFNNWAHPEDVERMIRIMGL